MTDIFEVEPLVRLHEDNESNVYLEIGSDPDCPNWVQIRTSNTKSSEYYGDVRLSLSPAKVRQFCAALTTVADQLEANPV